MWNKLKSNMSSTLLLQSQKNPKITPKQVRYIYHISPFFSKTSSLHPTISRGAALRCRFAWRTWGRGFRASQEMHLRQSNGSSLQRVFFGEGPAEALKVSGQENIEPKHQPKPQNPWNMDYKTCNVHAMTL